MKCPSCKSVENKVIESRINQPGDITRRRRECLQCQGRFTTYERIETVLPMLIKKDGRREAFSREKIFSGVQKACQKRPITHDQIDTLVKSIEQKVENLNMEEVPSKAVGQLVMAGLLDLDKVAYVRFASVYREFKDVEDFVADIKELN